MAIGASVDQGHNASTSTTSLAVTTLANIAFGDLIRVYHESSTGTATVASIVDPAGTVYTLQTQGTTTLLAQILAGNAKGAIPAGSTITVNFNNAVTRHGVSIASCSGAIVPADVVTNASAGTATASATLTFPALAQNEELLVAVVCNNSSPGAITWDQSFVAVGGSISSAFVAPAEKVVTNGTGGTVTPSWVNSVPYRAMGCSFPAGTIAPPAVSPPSSGGAVVGGRRRQILGRTKPQAEARWTRETPPEVIKPAPEGDRQVTAKLSAKLPPSSTAKLPPSSKPAIEIIQPAISVTPRRVAAKPTGPTWADMERARVELTRLRQELADQQDEDDVELLLVSLH